MNRAEIGESEHVAAQTSDLRSTNPWLASYGRDPATVAQIVGHADDRGDAAANRQVEILVQKSPTESLP